MTGEIGTATRHQDCSEKCFVELCKGSMARNRQRQQKLRSALTHGAAQRHCQTFKKPSGTKTMSPLNNCSFPFCALPWTVAPDMEPGLQTSCIHARLC